MRPAYRIKIRKITGHDTLVGGLILFPFLFGLLNELLGLPWSIRYLLDIAWCLLLVYRFFSVRRGPQKLEFWVWLFLIYTLLTYIPQWQSPLYYLWGMRNNFRLYGAFCAFAVFLSSEEVDDYMHLLDKLFWLDVAVSCYQFFALGLKMDYLGGLFGAEKGSNAYTNIFFLIIVARSIVLYLEKQEKMGICLAKCGAALVVAAMAELKFFFVEFILVVAMAVLFTSFSWRKLAVIIGAVVGVLVCAALLTALFPGFAGWFSLEWFFEAATSDKGYTSSGDLNRLNAISQINELWLQNGWQRLFGLGLGNCDTASYTSLNTPFFEAYGDMHYTWLSYAMIYLETGWIGLVFYWGFFALVYFGILRIERRSEGAAKSYCRISRIMAVLCVAISIYNSSLRTEAGYMVYFVLAIPFALSRGNRRKYLHG